MAPPALKEAALRRETAQAGTGCCSGESRRPGFGVAVSQLSTVDGLRSMDLGGLSPPPVEPTVPAGGRLREACELPWKQDGVPASCSGLFVAHRVRPVALEVQVHSSQVHSSQVCISQVCICRVCICRVCISRVCASQVCASQM